MSRAALGLGLARVAVGAGWLTLLASRVAFAGGRLPPLGRVAATVLAGRDVAQGGLLVGRPRRTSVQVTAAVDVVHAVTMLPVVAFLPRYRKSALVSAAVAACWVGAAGAVLRRAGTSA